MWNQSVKHSTSRTEVWIASPLIIFTTPGNGILMHPVFNQNPRNHPYSFLSLNPTSYRGLFLFALLSHFSTRSTLSIFTTPVQTIILPEIVSEPPNLPLCFSFCPLTIHLQLNRQQIFKKYCQIMFYSFLKLSMACHYIDYNNENNHI